MDDFPIRSPCIGTFDYQRLHSAKLTELWKITIFFMGKLTINGHFQ